MLRERRRDVQDLVVLTYPRLLPRYRTSCSNASSFTPVYWMVGLRQTAGKFFIWIAINLLQVGTAIGLGWSLGAGAKSIELANVFAPVINVIFSSSLVIFSLFRPFHRGLCGSIDVAHHILLLGTDTERI